MATSSKRNLFKHTRSIQPDPARATAVVREEIRVHCPESAAAACARRALRHASATRRRVGHAMAPGSTTPQLKASAPHARGRAIPAAAGQPYFTLPRPLAVTWEAKGGEASQLARIRVFPPASMWGQTRGTSKVLVNYFFREYYYLREGLRPTTTMHVRWLSAIYSFLWVDALSTAKLIKREHLTTSNISKCYKSEPDNPLNAT